MTEGSGRVCSQWAYAEAPEEFRPREMVHGDGAEAARGSPTQVLSGGSGDQRCPGEHGSRQRGSTAARAHPASTPSAMQWWELNLPTQQVCHCTRALPSTGWHPPSSSAAQSCLWECSPGNCTSLCQFLCSWPLKPCCLSGGMEEPHTHFPPFHSLLEPKNKKLLRLLQIQLREGHKQVLVHLGSICMLNFLIVTRRATFLGIAERLLEEWSVFPEQFVLQGDRMHWKWQLAGNHKEERNH